MAQEASFKYELKYLSNKYLEHTSSSAKTGHRSCKAIEQMKAAFAVWDTKISPVFDVTRQVLLVDARKGKICAEKKEVLRGEMPSQKALRLSELGVNTLVCGAISRGAQAMVEVFGIRVIPFVTGDLREVIQAWLSDSLENDDFAMPGCCGRRRRRGLPSCGSPGRAGPGVGRARSSSVNAVGSCVCPKCGQREPHQRGVPCLQVNCPACGAAMIRE
jgi:predicted Fe-Mo cluster-binding NifX family protein